jgi:protein FRG1
VEDSVFGCESREFLFRFRRLHLDIRNHPMADSKAPKSLKLKFKGEKSKKKRKHDEDDNEASSSSRSRRHDAQDDGSPEWVRPDQALEIRGPSFIFHPSDPSPLCISFDATRNRITLLTLEKLEDGGSILDRTPSEVAQVWVTTRVAGAGTINLRTGTGEGKFLSCDKHGLVTADREARGPQEEWTPVVLEDGMVAFMNVYEKYLGIDEVAGGQLALRGDSDTVGFQERFYVKIQNKYKQEAHEEERKKGGALDLPSTDEKGTKCVLDRCLLSRLVSSSHPSAIFQAWGAGRSVVSQQDKKEVRGPLLFHRFFVTDALPKA